MVNGLSLAEALQTHIEVARGKTTGRQSVSRFEYISMTQKSYIDLVNECDK